MTDHPKSYRMTTLGCRANHAEQREMEAILNAKGLIRTESGMPASLEVVHTCSVTSRAAAKSRQSIRQAARKRGPGHEPSKVIVTGCFASMEPDVVAKTAATYMCKEQEIERLVKSVESSGIPDAQRIAGLLKRGGTRASLNDH